MAKKDIASVVSGMGVAMSIITSLADAVRKLGGTDEDIHRLATPEGGSLIQKFAEMVVSSVVSVFTITVDYTRSLAQMISAGKYDWVNSDITEKNFPVTGTGKQEVVLGLLHFNKMMSSDQVLVEMKNRKLRPATLPELLAFGEKYPDEQRKSPIVALGSVWQDWHGVRRVPFLWSVVGTRKLDLRWFEGDWHGGYRFLAVRES